MEKYLEGKIDFKPPFLENKSFLEWKNRFEVYVKSIHYHLWDVISIGDIQVINNTFEKLNNLAKFIIYKAISSIEYERIFFCKTANDMWKNILEYHQEKYQVKDDHAHKDSMVDKYLVDVSTSTTSSNVLNVSTSEDEYVYLDDLACESRNETEVDEDNDPVGDCQSIEATSKVHVENKHFCFDKYILEFSKEENESKLLGNMNLKTIFNNESSKFLMNNFEKEILLEDKMSRLKSDVEIDLECKLCLDHKHEIKKQNEKGKKLAKFDESAKSLERLLKSQKSFEDKTGLGFNSKESSTSKTKQVNFVKTKREI